MHPSQKSEKAIARLNENLNSNVLKWLNEVAYHRIHEPNGDFSDKFMRAEVRETWRLFIKHIRPTFEVRFIKKCILLDFLQAKEKSDGNRYELTRRIKEAEDLGKVLELEKCLRTRVTIKSRMTSEVNRIEQAQFQLRTEVMKEKSEKQKLENSDVTAALLTGRYESLKLWLEKTREINECMMKILPKKQSDQVKDDQLFETRLKGCAGHISRLITTLNNCKEEERKDDVVFGLANGMCDEYLGMEIRETLFNMMNLSLREMMKLTASIDIDKDISNQNISFEKDKIIDAILLYNVNQFFDIKMIKEKIKNMEKENSDRKMYLHNTVLNMMSYETENRFMEEDIKIWIDSEIELTKVKTKKNIIWKNLRKTGEGLSSSVSNKEKEEQLIMDIERIRKKKFQLCKTMSNCTSSIKEISNDLSKIYADINRIIKPYVSSKTNKKHDEEEYEENPVSDLNNHLHSPPTLRAVKSELYALPTLLRTMKNIHWLIIQKILFPHFSTEGDKHKEIVEKWMRDSMVECSENNLEIIEKHFGELKERLNDIERKLKNTEEKLNMWIDQPFLNKMPSFMIYGLYSYFEWCKKFNEVLENVDIKDEN